MTITHEELAKAKNEQLRCYYEFKKADDEAKRLQKIWLKAKREYEDLDYQAALEDGRHQVVERKQQKQVKVDDLSKNDLLAVAEALGVKL